AAAPLAMAAGANGAGAGPNDQACRRTDNVVARTDGWTSIRSSLPALEGATPDPDAFGRIYAYNATTVARSDDGGCSWRTVFNAPATTTAAQPVAQSRITGVEVGGGVWVTTAATTSSVGTATVWRSATGTGNFSYAGAGLPVGGTILQLKPTERTGVAYALLQTLSGQKLYASSPAGGAITWQSRTVPNFVTLTAIAVDPKVPDIVDVATQYAYARSANGGASFIVEHRVPARITAIDAARNELDVYLASGRMLSVVAGTESISAPAGVLSATHVPLLPGVRAVATSYGDFGYDPTLQRWTPITPLGLVAQQLRMVSPTLPPVLYGIAGHLILELPLHFPYAFKLVREGAPGPGGAVSLHGVGGFGKQRPSFAPAARTITLPVGAQRRVPYTLRVPARSGPLDVEFLVDTTSSMQPAIAGLRHGMQQIIGALGHLTPNLDVGLADFRDYDDGEQAKENGICYGGLRRLLGHHLRHHLYVLDHRIAPVDAGLGQALGRLSSCGGGDVPEADTIAVMQSITGTGIPGWVPSGQEIGFRPNATKVIVLVTDAPMHVHAPYPSLIETTDALRAYGVNLVGIAIKDGINDAATDLRALAGGSHTDAPPGGLACASNGRAVVPAGAPMVCSVPITGNGIAVLAGPVARLIEQVVAPGLLSVHLQSSHAGLASFAGASREQANLHTASRLPVTVVYSCPASAAGSRTPITLTGAVGSTAVAHTRVVLQCLPAPVAPVVPPAAAVVAAVAAPPPPPPPLTSNINPNVNPGPGAATEEPQQSQLALADLSDQPGAQPATNDNGPDMGAPMLYAAALLLTGAAALALRLRPQPEPNLARTRVKGTR
ncbi:MAG: hypothetical protein ACTHK4_00800, partial [Mycobacteriales bacterium]